MIGAGALTSGAKPAILCPSQKLVENRGSRHVCVSRRDPRITPTQGEARGLQPAGNIAPLMSLGASLREAREEEAVNRIAAVLSATFAVVLLFTGVALASETVMPAQQLSIPANKSWDRVFALNVSASVKIEWSVEANKSIDIYVMTQAQDDAASNGNEPTRQGVDFIHHDGGVMGQGYDSVSLSAGRYSVIFRNVSDNPATVWSLITATRE